MSSAAPFVTEALPGLVRGSGANQIGNVRIASGSDLNVIDPARGRWHREIVGPQAFQVELDGFTDLAFRLVDRAAGCDASGKVRYVG
jgi:hypothetical protein